MARDAGVQYVWTGVDDEPEGHAWEVTQRFGVAVATLAVGRADPRQVHLALQVAGWLSLHRTGGGPAQSCLTCWSAPNPLSGTVRIPHLVSVRHGVRVRDAVVWELSARTSAREHVDVPDDLGFFESHLETLLELRAAARERRLPATPASWRLLDLLDAHGADLSIELVYRNADLFRLLLGSWHPLSARRRSQYGA